MKKLIIRALAGLLDSVLLVAGVALVGNMPNGKRTDGIFYQASGIHPDAALMTVNKRSVSAEEYPDPPVLQLGLNSLYALSRALCPPEQIKAVFELRLMCLAGYEPDLSSYMGSVDFDAAVSGGLTYGQYAMEDAQRTVVLYAVVRQWAQEAGITLSEESQAQLDAQRQQYVTYYGGEEGYAKQLELMGLTDEGFQQINQVYFLYSELYKAYCTSGGALRPSDEEIAAFAQSGGYCTFLPLYWSITGDEATDAATLAQAQEAAARLRSAEDVTAAYLQIAQELALQASETGETAAVQDLDSSVAAVLTALAEGQVSDVVTTAKGYAGERRHSLQLPQL